MNTLKYRYKKFFKYFFLSIVSLVTLIAVFVPEDPAWIDCSDESDLYKYVYNGWKVDRVIKDYKGEYPRIWLSKNDRIKALNFGSRCYYLEGEELNFSQAINLIAAEKYGDVIERHVINGDEYVITQEVTYQELWKIIPGTNEKKSIKKAFSIERFAEECEMIGDKPLFIATIKEYYFSGGWAEPRHLTIFNLKGTKVGIAPDWEYVEQFCELY